MNGAITKYDERANGLNGGAGGPLKKDSFVSESATGEDVAPKRIIICCDGTWQDSETLGSASTVCPTNVARLSNVLARAGKDRAGKVFPQLVFYQSGVGTGKEDFASKMVQGGIGVGLLENVIRAYNFIVNNYNHKDELYIFGFSRGAYTARALAGLVCGLGILKPTAMPEFRRQYFNYIRGGNFTEPFQRTMSWINFLNVEPDCMACDDVKIEVVGVWDTVGALGIPDLGHFWRLDLTILRRAFQFYDTDLHENIKNAYHALALDECRDSFKPTLWIKKNSTTNLIQCWFPGAHVNVGGGMQFESQETLAYISYTWMLDLIRPHLALDENVLKGQLEDVILAAELRSRYRLQSQGLVKDGLAYLKAFVFGPNALPVYAGIDPVGAPLDRMTDWLFNFLTWNTPRTPHHYHRPEAGEETCEYIHPSAICRYLYSIEHGQITYIPAALKNWTRVLEEYRGNRWLPVLDIDDNTLERRARWYKYKLDLLGNPVRNGRNEFIVENYIDELPQPQGPVSEGRPINGSIEGWLYQKSWSHLYFSKIGTVKLTPSLFGLLPTGLHSLILPEIHRYLTSIIPLVVSLGDPAQRAMIRRSQSVLASVERSDTAVHSHGGEIVKPKKAGKKGENPLSDSISAAPPVVVS